MSATHGPWAVGESSDGEFHVFCAEGILAPVIRGNCVSEKAAKARLIAAAPCLLDALNGLIAVIKDGIGDPEDIDLYQRALAVVAKATGAT